MSTTTYTSTNSRRCATCHQPGWRGCLKTCDDRMLEPHDGLSMTGVMDAFVEAPQSHAKGRVRVPRVPVGGIALVMVGMVLVGLGLVMREDTAWLIYNLIHG